MHFLDVLITKIKTDKLIGKEVEDTADTITMEELMGLLV
jgi:hypothetical protein